MGMTAGQLRAARGLIGWTQENLAEKSGVSRSTIADFEAGTRAPYDRTLDLIRRALVDAGVDFIAANDSGGLGVRLKH